MANWVKILAPSIVGLLVVVLVLMFSGLATSTILNSEDQYVTQTVVGLDVNVFAAVMILGVFLSVLVTSFAVNRK
jgi:purine-cytosine permease-like protein